MIARNPAIMGGQPCIDGTRIPTATVYRYHRSGFSIAKIVEAFPHVSVAQVDAAIHFERERTDVRVLVAPSELSGGTRPSVIAIEDEVPALDEAICAWAEEAEAGDTITLEVRHMTWEEIDALPDL